MGHRTQQETQAEGGREPPASARSAEGPVSDVGAAGPAPSVTGVAQMMALQRSIGNRATGRLVARRDVTGTPGPVGTRVLGRAPTATKPATLAARVAAAADKGEFKQVASLLSAAPMAGLLDACAELEASGKLTWIAANLPSSLKGAKRERVLAAISAVQNASGEEQMSHRLELGKADEGALSKWLLAHPESIAPPPAPEPEPVTRADGTVFDPPTTVSDDRGWVRALLRFMHLRAPADGGGAPDACTLDGQPSTVTDVALFVAETGLFGGNHPIEPDKARRYVQEYFDMVTAAAVKARDVKELVLKRDIAVLDSFRGMPMGRMLSVLDDLRLEDKLDDLSDLIIGAPPEPRLLAALLSAGGHLGVRWRAALDYLTPDEVDEIRHFLLDRVIYGDTFAPAAITKKHSGDPDSGKPFTRPPGADETWPQTVDDATWVDAFLRYFRLMKVPFDDQTMWFNEDQHPVDEIVDITVEQARLAGRTIAPEAVRKAIDQNRDHLMTRAPLDPNQLVIQWQLVPVNYHRDVSSGARTHDQPANQVQVGYTIKFKNVGAWWSEIDVTGLVQGTFFADPVTKKVDFANPKLQSLVVGAQAAWVVPLFTNKLQLQAIAQVVVGSARNFDRDSQGRITITPVGGSGTTMGQGAAQVQLVYQPFDDARYKWFQIFAGTGASVTVGSARTADGQPFFFGIGGAFDLGGGGR